MYIPDIYYFKSFYSTPLGALVWRGLRVQINELWPEVEELKWVGGEAVAGIGYTLPLLTPYLSRWDKETVPPVAILPARLGGVSWPGVFRNESDPAENLCVLSNEKMLPLKDASMDKILVVHALEFCDLPELFLQEIGRALKPLGRAIIIVPNRASRWARKEHSPFGYGRPFSPLQLEQLLGENGLEIIHSGQTLVFPPTHRRWVLKLSNWLRFRLRAIRFGGKDARSVLRLLGGGVLVYEVEKRRYAPSAQRGRMVPEPQLAGVMARKTVY